LYFAHYGKYSNRDEALDIKEMLKSHGKKVRIVKENYLGKTRYDVYYRFK
jgi:hypothetical protein